MPLRCPGCGTMYPNKYPRRMCWVCLFDFDKLRRMRGVPIASKQWRKKKYVPRNIL